MGDAAAGPNPGEVGPKSRSLRQQNTQLRSELRRARTPPALAGALHQDGLAKARSLTPRRGLASGQQEELVMTPEAVKKPANDEPSSSRDLDDARGIFSEDGKAFLSEQRALRRAELERRLSEAEASNSELEAEVASLQGRLASQTQLEAEAAELIAALRKQGGGGPRRSSSKDAEEPLTPRDTLVAAPPTARQAQLAQDCAKLRHWAARLRDEVSARGGVVLPVSFADSTPGLGARRARNEFRRLQQLEVIAHGLHKELRRLPSSETAGVSQPGAAATQQKGPVVLEGPVGRTAPPARNERMEQHLGNFCRRFAVRRSMLPAK